jgi:hypothetical protein
MRKLQSIAGSVWIGAAAVACGGGGGDDDVIVVVEEPPPGVFQVCDVDADCPAITDCHDVAIDYGDVIIEDAFCTVACGDDLDCPAGGICLGAASGPPLCYQRCVDDLDCPAGFACIEETIDYDFLASCVPY